jgi:hypothetical protein
MMAQGFAWWGVMRRSLGASASIMPQRYLGAETDGISSARSTGLVLAQHQYWLHPVRNGLRRFLEGRRGFNLPLRNGRDSCLKTKPPGSTD